MVKDLSPYCLIDPNVVNPSIQSVMISLIQGYHVVITGEDRLMILIHLSQRVYDRSDPEPVVSKEEDHSVLHQSIEIMALLNLLLYIGDPILIH